MSAANTFNLDCDQCPRLAKFLACKREEFPSYHGRPVPSFGDQATRFLIVGLAPGLHGANATGRPFTGDFAGVLLYKTLHKFGFSTHAESISKDDDLKLTGCRITNAVKCVPPGNKPETAEIKNCNHYLQAELAGLPAPSVVLALGTIAHNAVLRAMNLTLSKYSFGHGVVHEISQSLTLVSSYHCSRYNTQTYRLTEEMFHGVFQQVVTLLGDGAKAHRKRAT